MKTWHKVLIVVLLCLAIMLWSEYVKFRFFNPQMPLGIQELDENSEVNHWRCTAHQRCLRKA